MFKYLLLGLLLTGLQNQNNKRSLLLFADKNSITLLKQQQQLLQMGRIGLEQRDVAIKIYTTKDMAVWKRYAVRNGFTVVLIGKDGGEKLRSHQPVSTKKLFDLIDAMPMRKEEINHSGTQD